jgi:hypothetical protein
MPNTTIICAVWSQDVDRHDLLKQHQENILRQSIEVERVYVFERGDTPPSFLKGHSLISSEALSIYEAWNLAIAACRTKFVMNLNLDDRLNQNAVEILEGEIIKNEANLIGGDWKICYSQNETNQIENCYETSNIPFLPDWPPKLNSLTRLGSGVGERGTYGPATLWELDCHLRLPRYPYRMQNGQLIRSIADSVWWGLLRNNFNLKLHRLPIVIGNYHSHPQSQAEFRGEDEWAMVTGSSIALL